MHFKSLEAAISGELFQVYEVKFEDMFGGKTESDLVIAFFRLFKVYIISLIVY